MANIAYDSLACYVYFLTVIFSCRDNTLLYAAVYREQSFIRFVMVTGKSVYAYIVGYVYISISDMIPQNFTFKFAVPCS